MYARVVHVDKPYSARAFSLLWMRRIYIGRGFDRLPVHVKNAVFAHEHYHATHHHTEVRLLTLLCPLLWPFIRRICHAQEFAADQFAIECGFRKGLRQFLAADAAESLTHPSHAARRAAAQVSSGSRKGPIALSA